MHLRVFSSCCFVLPETSLTVVHSSEDVNMRSGPFAEAELPLQSSSKNVGF